MVNKIVAVVVTFNRKQLLLENIQKLIEQTYSQFDILIVDNHSTDGTYDAIRSFIDDERIFYFDTGSNLGGAGGFNFGLKVTVERGYDFMWIMDDDSMPEEDALEKLISAYENIEGEIGFLSSKVLWKDGSLCTMNLQRDTISHTVTEFGNDPFPVVFASFVSLFLPGKIVKEVGLPIKDFFIWTDDWEYTRRISKLYSCYVVPKSVVIHKSKSNIGANIVTEKLERLDRFDYLYRNDVYLYRREGIKGFIYEVLRLTSHCVRIILQSRDNRIERLKKVISGTKRGLSFHPVIEYPSNTCNREENN